MRWSSVSLEQVAPPNASGLRFEPDARVWYLTPDQIQGRTGNIIRKRTVRTDEIRRPVYIFDEGNVLCSSFKPHLGKVLCPDEPGIATSLFIPLRPRKDLLDRNYLMYYLRSDHFLKFANAFTDNRLSRIIIDKFLKHRIPLPSLDEQRNIVEILKQSEELNRRFSEADGETARILPALFYKIFGDPAKNPKNWPMKSFAEIIVGNPHYGIRANKSEWKEGSSRYLRSADITEDGCLADIGAVSLDIEERSPYSLESGDILFVRSGAVDRNEVGRTYRYQPQDGLCVYNDSLVRFRLDSNKILSLYLFAFTQTVHYGNWVRERKRKDIVREYIKDGEYLSLQVPCPPISSQKAFVKTVEELLALRKKLKTARKKTQRLFDVFLHLAFSGKLTAERCDSHLDEIKNLESITQARGDEVIC